MASDSALITVYVKSLTGDLIQLSVDPTLGLKGVEAALTLFDSKMYVPFQFRCFFLDEEPTQLTHGVILGLLFVPSTIIMHDSYHFRIKFYNTTKEADCIVFKITDYKPNLLMKKSLQPAVSYLSVYRVLGSENHTASYTADIHHNFKKRKDEISYMAIFNDWRDTIKETLSKNIPYIMNDGARRASLTSNAFTTISRIISEKWM